MTPDRHAPTPQEREQLAAWLQQYEQDRMLRETLPHLMEESAVRPEPIAIVRGQIRLLPPTLPTVPETERPVFVLILDCHPNNQTTLIPFGRFDVPATPGEWTTNLEHKPLKVLCFWNHRIIETARLEQSWPVSSLSDADLKTVAEAQTQFKSHKQRATPHHGPPLIHPLDPRHIYLLEEKTLLDDETRVLTTTATKKQDNTLLYPLDETDTELQRAAEDGDEYSTNNDTSH